MALASLGQLAKRLGLPARWLEAEAEAKRIPSIPLGRSVRFDPPLVAAILAEREGLGLFAEWPFPQGYLAGLAAKSVPRDWQLLCVEDVRALLRTTHGEVGRLMREERLPWLPGRRRHIPRGPFLAWLALGGRSDRPAARVASAAVPRRTEPSRKGV